MLLKQKTLLGIKDGTVTRAYRRWRRPTVKAGGTLLTPIGQLAIEVVTRVSLEEIGDSEALASGFPDLESLRSELLRRDDGDIYQLEFSLAGPDPRVELRQSIPDDAELGLILKRLKRLDSRSSIGPWTSRMLKLLGERPAERAADLARDFGMDKTGFKANVRKLKGLGLTESLAVGYRLSPRGEEVRSRLEDRG